MNEKEILIPASIIKENKDSYTVSIPGIGFNTEKKISKEGVVILEEKEKEELDAHSSVGSFSFMCRKCPDVVGSGPFSCHKHGLAFMIEMTPQVKIYNEK